MEEWAIESQKPVALIEAYVLTIGFDSSTFRGFGLISSYYYPAANGFRSIKFLLSAWVNSRPSLSAISRSMFNLAAGRALILGSSGCYSLNLYGLFLLDNLFKVVNPSKIFSNSFYEWFKSFFVIYLESAHFSVSTLTNSLNFFFTPGILFRHGMYLLKVVSIQSWSVYQLIYN